MHRTSSDATTSKLPVDPSESAGGSAEQGQRDFDWTSVVPLLHPVKVAVIEAMHHIGRPLSATDLSKSFAGGTARRLSYISYHVKTLAEADVIEKVSERQVRGATETFYRLP